ncbi:MAG: hypothetical protein JSW47_01750 [Phycisphaerales bacterium]|nr:MAG: hypothetical protein JSW47_01750 [Phycisphaerales bacterium]UCF15656.1 MAG: hypothetical protein JSW59_19855 [Phycisphaerales bacterium]
MSHGNMRFTVEQRLAHLERENVILHDSTQMLHRMLKEQQELIKDYIAQILVSGDESEEQNERVRTERAEKAQYTFTCMQRFERLEKSIEKLNMQTGEPALALSKI